MLLTYTENQFNIHQSFDETDFPIEGNQIKCIADLVEFIRKYLLCSDRITELLKVRAPNKFSIESNTFPSEPDDVPTRMLGSSSGYSA